MRLYGRHWTRRQLEERIGRIDQVAGARRIAIDGGPGDGARLIELRSGAGLALWVSPDRGMDIERAEFNGHGIHWLAPGGTVHPSHFDHSGIEWLRTAAGGLLMTCGLRQVGSPCTDAGESLGVHGRAHHTPADEVSVRGEWHGDDYHIECAGTLTEARLFGEHLVLRRTIHLVAGENRVAIEDVVENRAFEPTPLMVLYHFNFGFPLLGEDARLTMPSRRVVPREPGTPLEGHDRWQPPEPAHRERVYYHEDMIDSPHPRWGSAREAVIHSPGFPAGALRVVLRWDPATLPELVQWRMAGQGAHVLGIEPANCRVGGRAAERAAGRLAFLDPGESRRFRLELEVLPG
jgi:hypothetical protein